MRLIKQVVIFSPNRRPVEHINVVILYSYDEFQWRLKEKHYRLKTRKMAVAMNSLQHLRHIQMKIHENKSDK